MIKVIDNFLPKELYNNISSYIKGSDVPWFFRTQDTKLTKNKNGFYSFCYYNNNRPDHEKYYEHIVPIWQHFGFRDIGIVQVRATLILRDIDTNSSTFHTDMHKSIKTCSTAILYLTTCNAQTILKDKDKEKFVDSVENRLLLFDSNIEHRANYQTDVHKRFFINFNFFYK